MSAARRALEADASRSLQLERTGCRWCSRWAHFPSSGPRESASEGWCTEWGDYTGPDEGEGCDCWEGL